MADLLKASVVYLDVGNQHLLDVALPAGSTLADAVAAADQRREEQCKGMRQGMAALESGQRVRRFNDKGEPYFVDDAERGRELEKMRKDMATAKCG